MRTRWLGLAWVLAAVVSPATAATPQARGDDFAALTKFAEHVIADWPVTGMAIGVVRNDRVAYLRGFGVRSAETRAPVDGDTLFELASVSKSLSSALIGTYVDAGKIAWTDRVVDRLPWFQLADPAVTQEVRLADLLSHRVGVEANNWMLSVPGLTWEESVRRLRYLPQQMPFRTGKLYDNFMYSVGGLMVEPTAERYAAAMQARLFKPLGMARSTANFETYLDPRGLAACHECEIPEHGLPPAQALRGVDNVALLHVPGASGPESIVWRHAASVPASSAMSSAREMTRFLRMMLNQGSLDGRRVLSKETVSELLRPRIFVPVKPEKGEPEFAPQRERLAEWDRFYALGWAGGRYAGLDVRHHGGVMMGATAHVILVPARKIGVVVLSNERLYEAPHAFATLFTTLDAALGLPPVDWFAYFKKDQVEARTRLQARVAAVQPVAVPTQGQEAADFARRFAGSFCHAAYGRVQVRIDGTSIALDQGPERRGTMRYLGEAKFVLNWNGPRNAPNNIRYAPDGASLAIGEVKFQRCDPDAR